jgi:hypothetical protein
VYLGGLCLDELMFRIFFFFKKKKKKGLSITKRLTYTLMINLFFYSTLHSFTIRVMIDSKQFNNKKQKTKVDRLTKCNFSTRKSQRCVLELNETIRFESKLLFCKLFHTQHCVLQLNVLFIFFNLGSFF